MLFDFDPGIFPLNMDNSYVRLRNFRKCNFIIQFIQDKLCVVAFHAWNSSRKIQAMFYFGFVCFNNSRNCIPIGNWHYCNVQYCMLLFSNEDRITFFYVNEMFIAFFTLITDIKHSSKHCNLIYFERKKNHNQSFLFSISSLNTILLLSFHLFY